MNKTMTFRGTTALRDRLRKAAALHGRSISEEIEYRLQDSMRREAGLRRWRLMRTSRHDRRPPSYSPADPNWNAEAGRYKNHEEMLLEWHRVNDQISAFIGIEFLAERPPKYG